MLRKMRSNLPKPFAPPLLVIALMWFVVVFQCGCTNKNSNPGSDGTTTPTPAAQYRGDPKGQKKAGKEAVDSLVAEDYDAVINHFSDKLKRALTKEKLANDWTTFVKRLGAYQAQGEPSLDHSPKGNDVVLIRCRMEQGFLDIEVDYDDAGKINGLWIRPVN